MTEQNVAADGAVGGERATTSGGVAADDVLARTEVVLVSYKSRGHVEELLASWPRGLRVVLVDNARGGDGLAELADARPEVRYLDGGGQGFARGANLGAFSSEADALVFVNPDSRPTADDLRALVGGLEADPISVSHAATVAGPDGEVEIGVGGWEPSVTRTALYAAGLHKIWPRAGVYAKPRRGEALAVQWTTGACMAVRTAQFRRLGGFDEAFFVYCEDMSFGRRARRAGLRQVLRADVVVPHGAGSSGAPSSEMLRLRGASFANYVERYHPGLPARLMRAAMMAGYVARATQKAVQGDPTTSGLHRAMVSGLASRRAFVAGDEVARARFEETARA
ncbi:glycosyltransferase [Agilicoccus flavus]|uniref:glycosyltransferase n=1 Tax=Agilicoccus flavus TaxID=2775968 RepID=UPI001CF70FC4|nr:glycosyltransferase [Agilicoccus flavus]